MVQGQGTSLKIGEVAARAGVAIDTVRFYEREGLLPPVARSRAGYRLFPAAAVDRVAFIKKVQGLGFTLAELSAMLRAIDRGEASWKNAQEELDRAIERLDAKLKELRRIRRRLVEARETVGTKRDVMARIARRISFGDAAR